MSCILAPRKTLLSFFGNLSAFPTTTDFETFMSNASETVKN